MEVKPRVYVPFEVSGRVRQAFAARGWFAVSCDLKPTQQPCGPNEYHHVGDAFDLMNPEWLFGVGWDMMIAFPPCTYLAVSGLHWNGRVPGRQIKTDNALVFVRRLLDQDIPKIALENPIGCISSCIREPDQIIQPHWFGDDASKATCLWLKNLPPLRPTRSVLPRVTATGRRRWDNQTDSGQNKLAPSPDRAEKRALTYSGIAEAMADQWGDPTLEYRTPQQMDLLSHTSPDREAKTP